MPNFFWVNWNNMFSPLVFWFCHTYDCKSDTRGKPSLVPKQAISAWLCKKICYCLNFKYVLKVKRAYVQIIAGSLSTSQKAPQVSWIFTIFKSYALQMIVLAEFVKIDVHETFVWYAKINVSKKQFFCIPQKIN